MSYDQLPQRPTRTNGVLPRPKRPPYHPDYGLAPLDDWKRWETLLRHLRGLAELYYRDGPGDSRFELRMQIAERVPGLDPDAQRFLDRDEP